MRTKPTTSKILLQGKLLQSTRPQPHYGRNKPCAKMILYMTPADMKMVEHAISKVVPADLVNIDESGTPNGRAVAAICLAWLEGRGK